MVVPGVAGRDQVRFEPEGGLAKELIAGVPPGLFEPNLHIFRQARHVGLTADEMNTVVVAELPAGGFLFFGLLTLSVVEVSSDNIDFQPVQHVQQASAVGAAAVGDDNGRVRRDEPGDFLLESVEEWQAIKVCAEPG